MDRSEFVEKIVSILEEIQQSLYSRALTFREENTCEINDKEELYSFFTAENQTKHEIHGGFAWVHWDRDPKWEESLKNDLKVTIRCIPEGASEEGICVFSGKPSPGRVVLAKSY